MKEVTKDRLWQLLARLEEKGYLQTIYKGDMVYYHIKADGEWNGSNHIAQVETGPDPKFYLV